MSEKALHPIVEGLNILAAYDRFEIAVGHDIIYAGPLEASEVTAEDAKRLKALKWFVEDDSFAHFV